MYSQDWRIFSIKVGLCLIQVSFYVHFTALQLWTAAVPSFSTVQDTGNYLRIEDDSTPLCDNDFRNHQLVSLVKHQIPLLSHLNSGKTKINNQKYCIIFSLKVS
jgi:hypothetical protein